MTVLAVLLTLLVAAVLIAVPATWLVMLAVGNFGFAQFGFWDCLPAGLILAMIAGSGTNS